MTTNDKRQTMNKLRILENARELYLEINNIIIPMLDKNELFSIGNQLTRASLSIVLNIREGNSYNDGRKTNLFNIAMGSCEESDECIYLLSMKYSIIDYDSYNDRLMHIKYTLSNIIHPNNRQSLVDGRLS